MEEKQINPKFLVLGFFFVAFILFLIFAGPGDYMTGNVSGNNLDYGIIIDQKDDTFRVGEPLSMEINFSLRNGRFSPQTPLELLVYDESDIVANGTITLEQFMGYASNPPVIVVDDDGSEWFEDKGTYVSNALAFNVRYVQPCERNCNIELRVFTELDPRPTSIDDLNIVNEEDYANSKGTPFISSVLFSEMNELESATDESDLTYKFKEGDTLGCFTQFNNGESLNAKIYGPDDNLANPTKTFDNSSFEWDVCIDANEMIIPNCNLALVEYEAKDAEVGSWGCMVEVCNSEGCTSSPAQKSLEMISEAVNVTTTTEDCENGLDDDNNGFIDCSDAYCTTASSCAVVPEDSAADTTAGDSAGYGYQGYGAGEQAGASQAGYGDQTSFTGLKTGPSSTKMILIIVSVIFGILALGFWLWMLIDAITHKGFKDRIVWILIVVFLVVIGAIAYFFFIRNQRGKEIVTEQAVEPVVKEEVKPQDITPRVTTSSYDPLESYVSNMMNKGFNTQQIKEACVKAGWDKVKVDRTCNVLSLKTFVKEQLMRGFSKERLKESLISKGWKQDIIDDVFSRV